jgi:phosphoserine phosphatase
MGVLPSSLPDCVGYELASYSNPADETGGDIFDVIAIGNASHEDEDLLDDGTFIMPNAGLFLLLADATGHGIGPALSVTQVRAMLRLGLRLSASLTQLFTNINSQLAMDLSSDRFVTAFMGVLDPVRHRINYLSGGQGPLLHFHAKEKECEFLEASTVPMGIMDDPPIDLPEPMNLAPGDMAVLLTDGFYEAQNTEGKMMGKTRIGKVVAANCDRSAKEVLDALLKDMAEFVKDAPQLDDVTGLIVKRVG